MSRLKGADLGVVVTNPTLASLGGAKSTVGTGLPTFAGRLVGDEHYDPTTKVSYTLTGAAGAASADTFNRTSLGTTDESGNTYLAAFAGAGNIANNVFNTLSDNSTSQGNLVNLGQSANIDATMTCFRSSGSGGVFTRFSIWLAVTSAVNTGSLAPGGVEVRIAGGSISAFKDGSQVGSSATLAAISTNETATFRANLAADGKTVTVYKNNSQVAQFVTAAACTGTYTGYGIESGSAADTIDNWAAQYNGTLAWTPIAIIENVNVVAASGSAVTLPDVTTATMHRVTLTAATPAITLPAPGAGKSFTVELVQDATGGRAPTWATPSGAIRWPGGTAPTISPGANAIDVITFACIGGTNWYGFVAGQAFA